MPTQWQVERNGIVLGQPKLGDGGLLFCGSANESVIWHPQRAIVSVEADFSADLINPAPGAAVDFLWCERVAASVEFGGVSAERDRDKPVRIRRHANGSVFRQCNGKARLCHCFLDR